MLEPNSEPLISRGVDFAPRFWARALDLLPHYACLFAGGILVALPIAFAAEKNGHSGAEAIDGLRSSGGLAMSLTLLGSILAHALAEGFAGATLGKRLLGLTVVGPHGYPPGFLAAMKRSLAFLWDGLFFGILAHQKMGETPLRQRYGDHWGQTVVVRRSELDARTRPSDWRLAGVLVLSWLASAVVQAGVYLIVISI